MRESWLDREARARRRERLVNGAFALALAGLVLLCVFGFSEAVIVIADPGFGR